MKRIFVIAAGGALLAGATGLMIANAQSPGRVLIAGDRPVTAEQVTEKLRADGWSNIAVSRDGRYFQVTGSRNGEAGKIAVDAQTGRIQNEPDDDDDD